LQNNRGRERGKREKREKKKGKKKREKERKRLFPSALFSSLVLQGASSIRYTIELPNNKKGSRLKMQVIMKLSALYLLLLTSY
jgi:hypothetical protein